MEKWQLIKIPENKWPHFVSSHNLSVCRLRCRMFRESLVILLLFSRVIYRYSFFFALFLSSLFTTDSREIQKAPRKRQTASCSHQEPSFLIATIIYLSDSFCILFQPFLSSYQNSFFQTINCPISNTNNSGLKREGENDNHVQNKHLKTFIKEPV